jgi:tRNA pseudouridine55 synthase
MTRRNPASEYHGLLLLDKPGGITSRGAVNQVQRRLPRGTKIGHTGTLDPLATGVLVVCLGHATRLAEYVQAMPKTYRSTFLLGATSDTDDADGKITAVPGAQAIAPERIYQALEEFVGNIEQTPPAYSAVKVEGRRAHDLARKGAEVELLARRVMIERIDVLSYVWPHLEVEIRCSKGTYIRSIARDLGGRLGCGGLVSTLRRTVVGAFTTEQAVMPDAPLEEIREKLRPMKEAVDWMWHVWVNDKDAAKLRNGQPIPGSATFSTVVLNEFGEMIAICEPKAGLLHPVKVIPPME